MAKLSAGLLPYRHSATNGFELLLVHPGGPFWAKKDKGAWSVAKGEYEPDEDPALAADREFEEETGQLPPLGTRIDIGELRQPSGKVVRVFAVEAPDLRIEELRSNEFEMQWPPGSGRTQSFPEVDQAKWMNPEQAREALAKGQVAFVDRLLTALEGHDRYSGT